MRIIQSLNTFGDDNERRKCGFSTHRAMLMFLEQSYSIHSSLSDYCLYTDKYAYPFVSKFMKEHHIEVIDFPVILYDRIQYVGKFQVQELQTEAYIHVDIDAILYELPKFKDIICEKLRPVHHGKESKRFNIDRTGITEIICSGILGFDDMEFKNNYITKVYELLGTLVNEHNINFETCYTIEEVLLTRMAIDYNKNIDICEKYFHLQGKIK